jgi:hypothetical protein
MLSDERIRQIVTEATQRAMMLSEESLRKEAANLATEHSSATGDQRTEFGLMEKAYIDVMIHRGFTAK